MAAVVVASVLAVASVVVEFHDDSSARQLGLTTTRPSFGKRGRYVVGTSDRSWVDEMSQVRWLHKLSLTKMIRYVPKFLGFKAVISTKITRLT